MKSLFTILIFLTSISGEFLQKAFNFTTIDFIPKNITLNITDRGTDIACRWDTKPCYVECSSITANRSSLNADQATINKNDNNSLNFTLANGTCSVTKCLVDPILLLMNEVHLQPPHKRSLKRLLNINTMCGVIFANDSVVKEYIRLEKLCIDGIIEIPFHGSTQDYNLGDLALTVVQVDMHESAVNSNYVLVTAPTVFGNNSPLLARIPLEPFLNVSEEQRKVAVVSYSSVHGRQFMYKYSQNDTEALVSPVIRVEAGRSISHLSNLISINFTVSETTPISERTLQCRYFDENEDTWSSFGSFSRHAAFNVVDCSYNHMTPFAVLLVDVKIDKAQYIAMSFISYIGCGLSSFFSAAAVLIYMVIKCPKGDFSAHIHLSLSSALFLLNTSFIFTELAATLSIEAICVFVAVVIEYSLLCCFSWMAIEAFHLYLLLIKVFNTHIPHYTIKLSLFGWGVPAVLIASSLSVYNVKQFYGTKNVTFSDTDEVIKICWITETQFLYGMNLTYFSLMFLFNAAILWTVTIQICKLRRIDVKQSRLPNGKDVFTVLGLTCLLGMTWGLAFFSSGYTNLPILYLFCLCNTLQGLFMFLWVYGTIKKNRRSATETQSPYHLQTSMDK